MTLDLVIDTDPGNGIPATDVDDGLAIAFALASAGTNVAAITCVEGNVDHVTAGEIAQGLVDLDSRSIPVHVGHRTAPAEPHDMWRAAFTRRRQGPDVDQAWAAVVAHRSSVRSEVDAVEALIELVGARPGHYTILALGPLTNLANAIRQDSGFLANVRRIVSLAGAFTGPLGVRELNVAMDPESADLILQGEAPLTLLPLDVTRKTWLTENDCELLARSQSTLTKHVAATALPWVRWISASRGWPGANLHDAAAAAICVDSSLATTERMKVAVELQGSLTRSRLVRVPDEVAGPYPGDFSERREIDVVTALDYERIRALIFGTLCEYKGHIV